MKKLSRISIVFVGTFVLALSLGRMTLAQATSARSSRDRLIGAWHLVRIAPDADGKSAPGPQPKGMLVYTRDGHMSVQLMYPATQAALSNEYARDGYEASFGTYEVNESAHTVTLHVQGSVTRDQLVGKDLPRKFEFTGDGHLLIRSTRPDERWSVTWAHD
jgi:hypothetical protein